MYVRVCVRFLCMCACVGRVYLCVLVCNSKNDFRHSYCFFSRTCLLNLMCSLISSSCDLHTCLQVKS